MRYVPQLRRKHTSLYAVLRLSIFKTMNACNGVVERATRRPYTPSVGSVAIKHSSIWCPDVLVFTVTRKLFFFKFLPGTRGPLDLGAHGLCPHCPPHCYATDRPPSRRFSLPLLLHLPYLTYSIHVFIDHFPILSSLLRFATVLESRK